MVEQQTFVRNMGGSHAIGDLCVNGDLTDDAPVKAACLLIQTPVVMALISTPCWGI